MLYLGIQGTLQQKSFGGPCKAPKMRFGESVGTVAPQEIVLGTCRCLARPQEACFMVLGPGPWAQGRSNAPEGLLEHLLVPCKFCRPEVL